MSSSLISIIIPIYNAEKQLPKMLNSVLKQSYPSWEAILVNDGSTDQSGEILKQYSNRDRRFRYFSQPNSGPSVARNYGIKHAQGQFLSFIDADDWVSASYLQKLINPMITYNVDLVCAGYFEVNSKFPQGLKLHDFQQSFFNKTIDKRAYQSNLFNGVSGVLWGKLFKKEIFQKNNITLHPDLRLSEDLIAVLEYSKFIETAYIVPDSIYFYNRLDEDGLSSNLNIQKYENLDIFFNEVDKYKEELSFLDLEEIKHKRKYAMMIQLLKSNLNSKTEFYKVADYLVDNESIPSLALLSSPYLNTMILKSIFNRKYFKSWSLIKTREVMLQFKKNIN